MKPLDILDEAAQSFLTTVATVDDGQWLAATPCEDWDVGALVDHVIGGNRFTTLILAGQTSEASLAKAIESFGSETDRGLAVRQSLETQREGFRQPGALDRVCHHVAGHMPGSQALALRIADLTLHRWDLATALGQDATISQSLLVAVWETMAPHVDSYRISGRFGGGPSGTVPEDAELQTRLLDLSGRRP